MPYLNYLFCEKCGPPAKLDFDYVSTIEAYTAEGRDRATLDEKNFINDYLVYSCSFCKEKFKYDFQAAERRVREFTSNMAQEYIKLEKSVSADSKVGKRVREMYSK